MAVIEKTVFYGDTDISVDQGKEYIIESYIRIQSDESNIKGLNLVVFRPINYSINNLNEYTKLSKESNTDVFIKSITKFTAILTENIKIGLFVEYDGSGILQANVDSLTFKGPLDTLTQKKTIIYDSGCLYKNFNVKFIDSLGGYSYWTFRTYGDNGVQFGDTRQIKRNIFSDFPTSFSNAQAQNDYVSVESRDTVTLRAENLTEQQAIDLFELVRSVRVYDNNDPDKPKVLLVNKNSVSITQGEKLYNLSFSATSTFQNYRQRQ